MLEINAITLVTTDMRAALAFWSVLELEVVYGGPESEFTTLAFGSNFVNLVLQGGTEPGFWGRIILHVPSPDEVFERFHDAGYDAETEPADAPWGERYFHIRDADGHELSFARRL